MKVQDDVRVTVRVDKELKEQAEILFEQLGMNMSTALNIFLRKAVDEAAIPFPISVKKVTIGNDNSVNDITGIFNAAVLDEIEAKKKSGNPVARYDAQSKRAYLEYADGAREYVRE